MAMIKGPGFPAFRGGLMRYADSIGIEKVVERLIALSDVYGERFRPSELLFEMAKNKVRFYK
jgi:3-hydroxyacyl-CoA dehydrogenase/enoyl-CoA hydratase/3-hydroxybutyryl-CoA epimerase